MTTTSGTTSSCYLCGSNAVCIKWPGAAKPITPEAVRCTTSQHRGLPDLLECAACGLQYLASDNATDQRLLECYGEVVDETYLRNEASRRLTYARVLKQIRSWLPAGSTLVEVGSYCGFFLDEAAKAGFNVSGIEPSRWATSYSARFAQPVLNAALSKAPVLLQAEHDAVAMWDVVEHLTDPREGMQTVNRLLKPGGLALVATMDVSAFLPRLLGRHWPWYMPMHRFYFQLKTMEMLFTQASFELVKVMPYVQYTTLDYLASKLAGEQLGLSATLRHLRADRIIFPVYLGDVKLFIGRKTGNA